LVKLRALRISEAPESDAELLSAPLAPAPDYSALPLAPRSADPEMDAAATKAVP